MREQGLGQFVPDIGNDQTHQTAEFIYTAFATLGSYSLTSYILYEEITKAFVV